MSQKEKPTCRYCGSDNVRAEGMCSYDPEKEQWELTSDVFDGGTCEDCEQEMKYFDWIPI